MPHKTFPKYSSILVIFLVINFAHSFGQVYKYDGLNRTESYTNGSCRFKIFTYDPNGNILVDSSVQLSLSSISNNESCSGANNGTITVQATTNIPVNLRYALNGDTSSINVISNLDSGIYIVTVFLAGHPELSCTVSDTVHTDNIASITALVNDSLICSGDTVQLSVTGLGNHVWTPGNLSGSSQLVTPMTTTIYTVTGTSSSGCTNSSTVLVTVNQPTFIGDLTVTVCDSFQWHGNTYSNSGNYTYITTNSNGCKNTATLHLTVNHTTSNIQNVAVCNYYTWAETGYTYFNSETITDSSTNNQGCLHFEILNLIVHKDHGTKTVVNTCGNYTWPNSGNTYAFSGTYFYSYSSTNGCIVEDTLILVVSNATNFVTTATACDSYTWAVNNTVYNSSGTYTHSNGCATHTLNLIVNASASTVTNSSSCGSYYWSVTGNVYNSSGTYTHSTGCVTNVLNLTIHSATSTKTFLTACDNYVWPKDGNTYSNSGTYIHLSANQGGCQHMDTLVLTVNHSTFTGDTTVSACGQFTWNGISYTTSGDKYYITTNNQGCQNTATLHLIIYPYLNPSYPTIVSSVNTGVICQGTQVTMTASVQGNSPFKIYQWKRNGTNYGSFSFNPTLTFTPPSGEMSSMSCLITSIDQCGNYVITTASAYDFFVSSAFTNTVEIVPIGSFFYNCGSPIIFSTSITNPNIQLDYQWKLNGTNVGTNSSTFILSNAVDGDQVKCIVTTSTQCTLPLTVESTSTTINISTPQPLIEIFADKYTICEGETVTFSLSSTYAGVNPSYQWKLDGIPINGATNSTYSTSTLQQGQIISCEITRNNYCGTTTVTNNSNGISVIVNPIISNLTVSVSTPYENVCPNTLVTFNSFASVSSSDILSYQWYNTNIPIQGANSATLTTSNLNLFPLYTNLISVEVTPKCGLPIQSSSSLVKVIATPTVTLSNNTPLTALTCEGDSASLFCVANVPWIPSYHWYDNGQPIPCTTATLNTGPLSAGSHNFTCYVTSSLSCPGMTIPTSNTVSFNLTPKVTPTISIAATKTFICPGQLDTFYVTNSYPNLGMYNPSIEWFMNGVYTGQSGSMYITNQLNDQDVIFAKYIISGSCINSNVAYSDSIIVTVNNVIPLTLTLSSQSTTYCQGETAMINANVNVTGNDLHYHWRLNGSALLIDSNVLVIDSFFGNPLIECMVENACTSTTYQQLSLVSLLNQTWYLDADGDGYYIGYPIENCVSPGLGYTTFNMYGGNDCDDNNYFVHPGVGCTQLAVKFLIEGYYIPINSMQSALTNQGVLMNGLIADSVLVELRDSVFPFAVIKSFNTIVTTTGDVIINMPPDTGSYYIVVKHRNALETWSALPVTLNPNYILYDFTTGANKAYGSNQKDLGYFKWGFYSGDINQDGAIDAFDYLLAESDIISGNSGYLNTDLNGDGSVDAFDYLVMEENIINGVGSSHP